MPYRPLADAIYSAALDAACPFGAPPFVFTASLQQGGDHEAASDPQARPGGGREFMLRDPDGYQLVFFEKG